MGSVATHHWSRTRSCATLRARHLDGASWMFELSGGADTATLGQFLPQRATMQGGGVVAGVTRLTPRRPPMRVPLAA